jgi:hypothetical protein
MQAAENWSGHDAILNGAEKRCPQVGQFTYRRLMICGLHFLLSRSPLQLAAVKFF